MEREEEVERGRIAREREKEGQRRKTKITRINRDPVLT